jgi:DNA-binding CsgD family transcriptional regulator
MRAMRVAAGSGVADTAIACELIGLIGREDFGSRLLRLMREPLRADLISSMMFAGCQPAPFLFFHDTVAERNAELRAMRGYFSGCYREDPNAKVLLDDLRPGDTVTIYMSKADVPTLSYRRLCYDEPRLIDRLSVLHKTLRGDGIAVNFYRSEPGTPFDARDFGALTELAPLLQAVSARHYELISARLPIDFDTARRRLTESFPRLTMREAQCAAGVIAGLTAEEIALRLGIRATSVITHRKLAYERLGVSGQRELIALFYTRA